MTLEQLVLVIHSVVSQTAVRPRAFSPAELAEATKQISALIGAGKTGKATALQQGINDMQAALLKKMPKISGEIVAQPPKRAKSKRDTGGKS
ncbi:hypothetical protein [Streptomyces sp. STR69]|uniref:hypothetical protein n=1 Tax=Streptomyces sp. STR69 TaxID=1796942 RepID=UPI0021C66556|nr:hypothetical protein [Streptomyces sp. STR69]